MLTGLALVPSVVVAEAPVQPATGSMDVHWDAGAADCRATPRPPLQVHAYDARTFILRQGLCVHFEGNFLYLLVGSKRALLIDTGAIADPALMPLATTVLGLLPGGPQDRLPLLVVHTHGHTDHRDGDVQFASRPGVESAPWDLKGVQAFFGFDRWPDGVAHLDLGDRVVDVVPVPGHHPAHVAFYDNETGLLFTGDFLMPGRLLIDDLAAYRASAARLIDYLKARPVTHVLGGHIELDRAGETFPFGSQYHPEERPLALSREDLLALPAALQGFNGFYAPHPHFVLTNSMHVLGVLIAAVITFLALAVWTARRFWRRRRKRSTSSAVSG